MGYTGRYRDEDDQDYEAILEDRREAAFDPDAAQDRYERFLYGD